MGMSGVSLRAHPKFGGAKGPVVVAVMDGIGHRPDDGYKYNAVRIAHTPNLDLLARTAPTMELYAHGTHVGLPTDKDIGNSDVGHNAYGAGKRLKQGAKLVNEMIDDGSFNDGPVLNKLIANSIGTNTPLHLIGLLQQYRSVHSSKDHLFAIVRKAAEEGVQKIRVHGIIDGRDDEEGTAQATMEEVEAFLASFDGRDYAVASSGGREIITMDRNLDMPQNVELGWKTHVHGEGRQFTSASEGLRVTKGESGKKDQYLAPFVVARDGEPIGKIEDGHSVIFFNYRGDRAVEICQAFEKSEEDFRATGKLYFDRGRRPEVMFAGMLAYDSDAGIPSRSLVIPPPIEGTMGELLAARGIPQYAVAETTKYGHVTYFWNGNRRQPFNPDLEIYQEIPGLTQDDCPPGFDDVCAAYPWMRAVEVTTAMEDNIRRGTFRFARMNWANGDMVGHTGDTPATVLAVGVTDYQVGRLMRAVEAANGVALISSDHGNSDETVEIDKKTGRIKIGDDGKPLPRTGHTKNKVLVHAYAPSLDGRFVMRSDIVDPSIRNIAATALGFLGYDQPDHMDPSLVDFVG